LVRESLEDEEEFHEVPENNKRIGEHTIRTSAQRRLTVEKITQG